MRKYKCLLYNEYKLNDYSLVPIRNEDKLLIMQWRNEQMFHLRQPKPLTIKDQENYFDNIIAKLFEEEFPYQLLFSYLKNGKCIGYGGLVHISWANKNAEVSFLMNTANEAAYEKEHWSNFLKLIDKVAFDDLAFNKIYCYAYDVRPHLYKHLINNKYVLEARLEKHYMLDNKYFDVVIHSKFRNKKLN